jgi:hypothetical protein
MRWLCRIGIHGHHPKVVGRWYANWRCTRCGADLRTPLPAPDAVPSGEATDDAPTKEA